MIAYPQVRAAINYVVEHHGAQVLAALQRKSMPEAVLARGCSRGQRRDRSA